VTARDREHDEWIPWYVEDTPGWLDLTLAARGAMEGIARKLNRKTGQLYLRRGLSSLAVLLHVRWEELEPALAELVSKGKVTWDGSHFVLADPDYVERKRRSGADRVKAHRDRLKDSLVTHVTLPASHPLLALPVTGVTPVLVSSDLVSSDLRSEIASGEVLDRTAPLDDPARMVFATIAMNREVGQTVEVCWTSFAGHYAGQFFPNREAVLGRWQKWVNQQAVYAEKAREQDRKRADAEAERKRFAKEGPAKPPPATKAQDAAFAEELASRVRASRAARAAGGGQ
jgi:hypothetical protein